MITWFAALRASAAGGYRVSDFLSDIRAGTVVASIALPMAMALAIGSGVPPQYGLYTLITGGFVIAIVGGSRFQVSGPTAAFMVVLAPITARFGMSGLMLAGAMAGVVLMIAGFLGAGRLIRFIPFSVTCGFTTGIAVVIALLQVKDFLGLQVNTWPPSFLGKMAELGAALGTWKGPELATGVVTLALLIIWPRIDRKVPGPLVALAVVSVLTAWARSRFPEAEITTIASQYAYSVGGLTGGGIPPVAPSWVWPSEWGPPGWLTSDLVLALVPSAFSIAILGAVESLFSAVVADGLTQTRHNPDQELVAVGIGNIVSPFFQGFACTGAVTRTVVNIRYGARSPLGAVTHALATLGVMLAFAPAVSMIPMSALAALLIYVSYHMADLGNFGRLLRSAPRGDALVLVVGALLTIFYTMVIGVMAGLLISAVLLGRRLVELDSREYFSERHLLRLGSASRQILRSLKGPQRWLEHLNLGVHVRPHPGDPGLPVRDVVIYEIFGPLFFGTAEKAVVALTVALGQPRCLILDLEDVSMVDLTGRIALESATTRVLRLGGTVYWAGARPGVAAVLERSSLLANDRIKIVDSVDLAIRQLSPTDA